MLLAILAALTELGPVGVRSWSGNGLGAVAARALVLPLSCRAHSRPGGCPVAPRQCGRATDDGDKESTAGGFAPCSAPRATSIGGARSGWRAWAAAAPVPRLLAKRWTIPAPRSPPAPLPASRADRICSSTSGQAQGGCPGTVVSCLAAGDGCTWHPWIGIRPKKVDHGMAIICPFSLRFSRTPLRGLLATAQ
jgi:hypothetical protein